MSTAGSRITRPPVRRRARSCPAARDRAARTSRDGTAVRRSARAVLAADDAHELGAVLGRAEHVLGARRPRRERVRVVEGARVGQPVVQHAAAPPRHRVPADLRHLQARGVEVLDGALQQADALRAAQLGRRLEQQLHAHAETDQRHARVDALAQQLVEAQPAHVLHRLRHRAHAGQDDAVGLAHARVLVGELGPGADVLERLVDRAQVAHAVVEDGERGGLTGRPWWRARPGRGRRTRPPRAARARTP